MDKPYHTCRGCVRDGPRTENSDMPARCGCRYRKVHQASEQTARETFAASSPFITIFCDRNLLVIASTALDAPHKASLEDPHSQGPHVLHTTAVSRTAVVGDLQSGGRAFRSGIGIAKWIGWMAIKNSIGSFL